jgi:hypothetical protein
MQGQPHTHFLDRQAFVDELLSTIRINPDAVTQRGMAKALGVHPRTVSRWLKEFEVSWPPVDRKDWKQLARQAVRPPATDAWLITCRVSAATLSDAESKLRAEDGIFIIEAKRLESASIPASLWRVASVDTP